jgi:phage terminase large subunit-like protein
MLVNNKAELLALLELREQRKRENKIRDYIPYEKQKEFHSTIKRERLFMAGNQLGKTLAGAAEMTYHLTGEYPEDWKGRRFKRPVMAWASGVTGESVRDTTQRLLMGRPGEYGTGYIPKRSIVGDPKKAMGVPDLLDSVAVRHISGGISRLYFKSYEKGQQKWQGETLDIVWFDEEPPEDIYTEGLARTNATGGFVYMTFTPLQGMSVVVKKFLTDPTPERAVIRMTIYDVDHYTEEQRKVIIDSYPEHEREARANGIPTLGSGAIFPVAESSITVEQFAIPPHWARIAGQDFGWDHPSATCWLAHDRDADIVYLYDVYKASRTLIPVQASAINARGNWIPVAWPHDGYEVKDAMHGEQIAAQYRKEGVNMMPESARFLKTKTDDREGSIFSVEAGIIEMLTRMQTGRFKVFKHLEDWLEEFRIYHRKDGVIVKEFDDAISASRYAMMQLRSAVLPPVERRNAAPRKPYNWRAGV